MKPSTGSQQDPAVVAPQERARARRTVPRSEPSRRLQPGDLVCGDCGEGNLSTRKFCSRCGGSLADAEAVRPKWWQRLIPRRKPRKAEPLPADAAAPVPQRRQHKRSILPVIRRTVAVLLLLAGIAYAVVPGVRGWANPQLIAARDWAQHLIFGKYVPVRAVKATSSPVDKKHPAVAAVDGYTNTYWATPVSGSRRLVLRFQEPVELSKAKIRAGIVGELRGSQRPKILHLVYPSDKGQDLKLEDHTDAQDFDLDSGGKVDSVEIYIQAMYDNADSKLVAISEIELYVRE